MKKLGPTVAEQAENRWDFAQGYRQTDCYWRFSVIFPSISAEKLNISVPIRHF
jgi:hypothetical protein